MPAEVRLVGRHLDRSFGEVEHDEVRLVLSVILGVSDGLVQSLRDVGLAVGVAVEELDLTHQRVVGVEIGDDVRFA